MNVVNKGIYLDDEKEEDTPELLEVPEEHIYNIDEKENAKECYTDETITRSILIKLLNDNGISGISKLKKSELLERVHEMHIPFPEVTDEQNQSKSE